MEAWYNNVTSNFNTFRQETPPMTTKPSPSVPALLDELRRLGKDYETLMSERGDAEEGERESDRSVQDIDEDIDAVMDQTMTIARQLKDMEEG